MDNPETLAPLAHDLNELWLGDLNELWLGDLNELWLGDLNELWLGDLNELWLGGDFIDIYVTVLFQFSV
jgi:hypothetical protein